MEAGLGFWIVKPVSDVLCNSERTCINRWLLMYQPEHFDIRLVSHLGDYCIAFWAKSVVTRAS